VQQKKNNPPNIKFKLKEHNGIKLHNKITIKSEKTGEK